MYQLLIFAFQTSLAMTANEKTIPIPCNSTKHSFRDSSYDTNIDEDRNGTIPELDKSNTCYRRNIGGFNISMPASPFHGFVEADYKCQDVIEGIMANITKKRRYDISLEYTAHAIASEYVDAYLEKWDDYNRTLNEEFTRARESGIGGEDGVKKMQEIDEKKNPANMTEHVKRVLEPKYPVYVAAVVSITELVGDVFPKIAAEIRAQRKEALFYASDGYGCSFARFKASSANRLGLILGCVPRNLTCTLVKVQRDDSPDGVEKEGKRYIESWRYNSTVSPTTTTTKN